MKVNVMFYIFYQGCREKMLGKLRDLLSFCLFNWIVWFKNLLSQVVQKREKPIVVASVCIDEKKIIKRHYELKPCPQHSAMERRTLIWRMKMEVERLKSFKYWTCPYVSATDLAKEGFFYFNQADYVQCIFCFGIISNWEPTDTVEDEHQKHFPYCPRVLQLVTDNLPLTLENRHQTLFVPPPFERMARYFNNRVGIDEPDR